MNNRICIWVLVGGLTIFWLSQGTAAANCQMETSAPGPQPALTRHLSAGCTEQEREARSVDATELLQAFREGRGIDLSGVIVHGDLSLDTLPLVPLLPELEGMKELQGQEARAIPGAVRVVDSVVRGAIRYGSKQGVLMVKGPLVLSGTRFEQVVDLSRSVFVQPVTLSGAQFLRESYFVQGRFLGGLSAEKTLFGPHTRFHRSVFQGPVTFQQSKFDGLAEFLEVTFEKNVDLSRSSFKLGTGFSGSRFQGSADFSEVLFEREAFFTFALFDKDALFRGATFRSAADFSDASFKGRDDFSAARFDQSPQFTRTARSAAGPTPTRGEDETIPYTIIFSVLACMALLIVYRIWSRR